MSLVHVSTVHPGAMLPIPFEYDLMARYPWHHYRHYYANQITTSWELPMNKSQIIALYDQDQRKDAEFPGLRREVTPEVVDRAFKGEL
jgi:hypothetical protein